MDSNLIWLLIFLPLMGAIIQAAVGKSFIASMGPKQGRAWMGFLAVLPVAIAFFVALGITLSLAGQPAESRVAIVKIFDWITLQNLSIPFELRVDPLSMTMALVVTGIGGLIHIFATGYMADEPDYPRFFSYLNLFIVFMLTLVLGNNLALLFIGWEGVGLCSYLLIGFWYKDLNNSKAANKAFIVNRIGDVGLTLGIFYIAFILAGNREVLGITDPRWLSYDVILPAAETIFKQLPTETTIICLLLFVGAMGKSAQFPLYVWLPDAMAGPTPVSALIHAATMVTSGVVLLNRMSPLYSLSPLAMTVVALVGALTALLGASIAFGQTDIKKVLAYSTVSQLGYMFIACGVGAFWGGMFHVITHAFFKALLFLGSGAVIYAMAHDQDMRNYGNLFKKLPITGTLMMIGYLAIAGVPFLFAGFWSKEAVLGYAVNDHATLMSPFGITWGAFAGWVGFLVALMTAFYMTRMMILTFFSGQERWRSLEPAHAHAHGHDDHGHHAHSHLHGHDDHHHEDSHDFFMSDEEAHALHAHHDHHHSLDKNHEPKEVPAVMWLPLTLLAFGSTGITGWLLYGTPGNDHSHYPLKQEWLYPVAHGAKEAGKHVAQFNFTTLLIISSVIAFAGMALGWFVYSKGLPKSEGHDEKAWNPVLKLAGDQWKIDWLFSNFIALKVGASVGGVLKWFDEKIVDGIVMGFGALSQVIGSLLRKPQTGKVREYALLMQFGVIALVIWMVVFFNSQGGGN